MRRSRMTAAGLVWMAFVLMAGPATAGQVPADGEQQRPAQPPARPAAPPQAREPMGFRAFFAADADFMSASKSFDAVLGTSTLQGLGGGFEVTRLWKNLFVRGAVTATSKDGERVFALDDGTVVNLGIDDTISMVPIEIGAGWRFERKPRPARPGTPPPPPRTPATPPRQGQRPATPARPAPTIVGYAGGGLLMLRYKETAQFGTSDDNTNKTFPGFFAFGGVEFPLGRTFFVGGEAQFRSVPNAIGDIASGVSTTFKENDLGGFTLRALIGIRK